MKKLSILLFIFIILASVKSRAQEDYSPQARTATGIGIAWHDYVFNNKITLVKQGGMVRPADIPADSKKTKLNTFSLIVPLMLEYTFSNTLFVSAGAYGQLILDSHTKHKFPRQKIYDSYYLDMFQGGVTARIGVKNLYVFGNYSLTDLFQSNKGPQTAAYTFGFGIR